MRHNARWTEKRRMSSGRVAPNDEGSRDSIKLNLRKSCIVPSSPPRKDGLRNRLGWSILFILGLVTVLEVTNHYLHDTLLLVQRKLAKTDHAFQRWNLYARYGLNAAEEEEHARAEASLHDSIRDLGTEFKSLHQYTHWAFPHARRRRKHFHEYRSAYDVIIEYSVTNNNNVSDSTLKNLTNLYYKRYKNFDKEIKKTFILFNIVHAVTIYSCVAFVLYMMIVYTNILLEARRQSEVAGQWRNAHRTLIKKLGVPCFLVNAAGFVIDVNLSALETFGFSSCKHELIGHSIDLVLPGIRQTISFCDHDNELDDESCYDLSSARNVPQATATSGRHHSGEPLDILLNRTVSQDSQGRIFHTIVAQDLTALVTKEREVAIQKKCLSQFTHEMRNKYVPAGHMLENILEAISSTDTKNSQTLYSKLEPLVTDIQVSLAQLEEADQLVSTRLQLHKIFHGNYQSEPNVQSVDIFEVMQSRTRSASSLGSPGVVFRATIVPEIYKNKCVSVSLDTFVFSHICNNLLSNARKHTHHGYIELSFLGEDNGFLHFATQDTGKGMPPSIQSRLFKEEVASGDVRGVGLGLMSAKEFLLTIGGDITLDWTRETTIENPIDSGTRFSFHLPGKIVSIESIEENQAIELTSPQRASMSTIPTSLKFHILDDSDIIRKSFISKCSAVAKRLGYDATWTFFEYNTVEEILPKINTFIKDPRSVLIADQNLDSKGGVLLGSDLIQALIKAQFRGCIISASGDDATQKEHKNLGANIIWSKPMPRIATMIDDLAAFYSQRSFDFVPDERKQIHLAPLSSSHSTPRIKQSNTPNSRWTHTISQVLTPTKTNVFSPRQTINTALSQALTAIQFSSKGLSAPNSSRQSSPGSQMRKSKRHGPRDTLQDSPTSSRSEASNQISSRTQNDCI